MKYSGYASAAFLTFACANAHASSLPQMDANWYPNQLLWLAISFIALYAAVARFVAPTIAGIIRTRESAINDAIHEAERAKYEAESTRGNVESTSQGARAQSAEIMAKMQAEISREAAEASAKLDRELARKADHASALLEEKVAKASSEISAAAQELAAVMAQKLLSCEAARADSEPKLKLAVKR